MSECGGIENCLQCQTMSKQLTTTLINGEEK